MPIMSSSHVSFVLMIIPTLMIAAHADEITELFFQDGIPSRITCVRALPKWDQYFATSDELSKCRITKNDDEIFFKTNVTRHQRGVVFTANSSWNGSAINVSAQWEGNSYSRVYNIIVKISTASHCDFHTINDKPTAIIGKSKRLGCPAPENMRSDLTKKEMEEFHVTWYRGCDAISKNDTKYSYEELKATCSRVGCSYSSFNTLTIPKPSMNDNGTPFKCVVNYRNSSFEAHTLNLTVRLPTEYVMPVLLKGSPKYVVSRGSPVNLTCSWRYSQLATATAIWKKSDRRICANNNSPCSLIKTIAKDNSGSPIKEMTSVLTLTNVDRGDAGTYNCIILVESGPQSANTSITILSEKEATVTTIVSATVLAILFVITVMIFVYFYKRIEMLYIYKKIWVKYVETENPVTYLIYGDDSCVINNDRNPVNDVTNWLTTRGVAFCDQSKGKDWSDTGAPIADRSIALMDQCLSLTIFLTPSLLNDNTLELFKTYSGFKENIRKKKFPIVFICSKEFEKRITKLAKTGQGIDDNDLKAGNSQETYRTFLKFMRRNIIVHWFPQNNIKFYRSLYVALPKVVEKKGMSIEEA